MGIRCGAEVGESTGTTSGSLFKNAKPFNGELMRSWIGHNSVVSIVALVCSAYPELWRVEVHFAFSGR